MINHYQEFDDFMNYFEEARKYALDNAEYFSNIKSDNVVYSTPSDFLFGIHMPSLVLELAYSKSFRKGKIFKNLGDRKEYMSYEYDDRNQLIKISSYDEDSFSFCCIFRLNGFQWAVPVYKYKDHYCELYKAEMLKYDEHGRISVYALFDTAQIWMEKYTYSQNEPLTAVCEHWNYIPKLSHSSKDKLVSETGSPAELWVYKLDTSDSNKITGELVESYTRDVSAYRQNPPCLPPPQISYKKY